MKKCIGYNRWYLLPGGRPDGSQYGSDEGLHRDPGDSVVQHLHKTTGGNVKENRITC